MVEDEKRLYPRLALRIEDGYFGNFKFPNQESVLAPIVNLSAGGLNAAVPETSRDDLDEGHILLLRNISGGANMAFLSDIKAEVRWIEALESTRYVSVGCCFLDISEEIRRQLIRFVDSERMARGQYH